MIDRPALIDQEALPIELRLSGKPDLRLSRKPHLRLLLFYWESSESLRSGFRESLNFEVRLSQQNFQKLRLSGKPDLRLSELSQ